MKTVKEYRTAFGDWAYDNRTRIRRSLRNEGLGLSVKWAGDLLCRYIVSVTCPDQAVNVDAFNSAMVWVDDGSERAKTIRRCIQWKEYLLDEFEREKGLNIPEKWR